MAATVMALSQSERSDGKVHIDVRMSVIRQPLLEWCSSIFSELGGSTDAKGHAEQWQEVLSSAGAHHVVGTLFRTKDTIVTADAEADDVNLLEEDGDPDADEHTDDQEQLPAAGVEGVPTAVPHPEKVNGGPFALRLTSLRILIQNR